MASHETETEQMLPIVVLDSHKERKREMGVYGKKLCMLPILLRQKVLSEKTMAVLKTAILYSWLGLVSEMRY